MLRDLLEENFKLRAQLKKDNDLVLTATQKQTVTMTDIRENSSKLAKHIRDLNPADSRYMTTAVVVEHEGRKYAFETNLTGGQLFVHELLSPEEADQALMLKKLKGE